MEARNRLLPEWFERVRTRQIALPRFQRMEAWGPNEVSGLLGTVLQGLPAGATLTLEVGDEKPFVSRTMIDAPEDGERITELLLDGQQRLTCLWRSLNGKYTDRTYLVGFEDDPHEPGKKLPTVYGQSRWMREGKKYPLWVDNPQSVWERGHIPIHLLRPGDITAEIDEWIEAIVGDDYKAAKEIDRAIQGLRAKVAQFNLPFLSLPPSTPKDVALDVFIKMNTSSVRLTTFDIIVAQLEAAAGESLHDMLRALLGRVPHAADYKAPENLVLDVAALMQGRTPSQSGYWGLSLEKLVEDWDLLIDSVKGMVGFLEGEGVFDNQRLPTDAVQAVIAALWRELPTNPDDLGNAKTLLRKYLWRSFFTSRYEQSAATGALNDFRGLRALLRGEAGEDGVPILNELAYPLPSMEQIIGAGWPKRRVILGRGVLALTMKCGARDIADDALATREHLLQREYHHLFPDAVLKSADIPDDQIFCAMNCALITWRTNRKLSCKEPLVYLRERSEANMLGEEDLQRRLRTHLIPYAPLAVGDYATLDDESRKQKICEDYGAFLQARAIVVRRAIETACSGREIDVTALFAETDTEAE